MRDMLLTEQVRMELLPYIDEAVARGVFFPDIERIDKQVCIAPPSTP
eukprot:COSAG03_NODE_20909_length_312_cov_0.516432_1_plen_47_part_00